MSAAVQREVSFDDRARIHMYELNEEEELLKKQAANATELYQQETRFYSALVKWKMGNKGQPEASYTLDTSLVNFFQDPSCVQQSMNCGVRTVGQLLNKLAEYLNRVWCVKEITAGSTGKNSIVHAVICSNLVSEFLVTFVPYSMHRKEHHLRDVYYLTKMLINGVN